jgi:hypothetical protein
VRSVRTAQTPSMVCPGVWRKSKRALPNCSVSPSLMAVLAGDEVGVEMRLDDVLDLQVLLAGVVDVEVDVALRVDDGGDAFGCNEVGGVGEAAEKELFDLYRFHGLARAFVDDSTGLLPRSAPCRLAGRFRLLCCCWCRFLRREKQLEVLAKLFDGTVEGFDRAVGSGDHDAAFHDGKNIGC